MQKHKEEEKDCDNCMHKWKDFRRQEPCVSCIKDVTSNKGISGWIFDGEDEGKND